MSLLEWSAKEYRGMTCMIVGCERRIRTAVLGSGAAPATPGHPFRTYVARRELRPACVVGLVDTADGTQRWIDPKPAHIVPACRFSVGHAFGSVLSSGIPSTTFHPPHPE